MCNCRKEYSGGFINYYLAFDAYYIGREDIRSLALANGGSDEKFDRTRVVEMHNIVTKADFQPLIGNKIPLTIKEKTFYISSGQQIFKNCNTILSNVADQLFEYETRVTPKNMSKNFLLRFLTPKQFPILHDLLAFILFEHNSRLFYL